MVKVHLLAVQRIRTDVPLVMVQSNGFSISSAPREAIGPCAATGRTMPHLEVVNRPQARELWRVGWARGVR